MCNFDIENNIRLYSQLVQGYLLNRTRYFCACVYVRISSQVIFVSWLELAGVPKEFADVGQGVRIVWYCIIGSTRGKTETDKKVQWEMPLLAVSNTWNNEQVMKWNRSHKIRFFLFSFSLSLHLATLYSTFISGSVEMKAYGNTVGILRTCYNDWWLIRKICCRWLNEMSEFDLQVSQKIEEAVMTQSCKNLLCSTLKSEQCSHAYVHVFCSLDSKTMMPLWVPYPVFISFHKTFRILSMHSEKKKFFCVGMGFHWI